ncbi:MAG: DUF4340 domain-containing protein [bacterium]
MKKNHALAAFFALLLLGAFVLFLDPPFLKPEKGGEKLFPNFDPKSVVSLRIRYIDRGIFLFREKDGWRVSSFVPAKGEKSESRPESTEGEELLSFPADSALVNKVLQAISGLESSGVISNNPEKYALFQVNELGAEVEVSDGKNPEHFLVGKIDAAGNTFLRKLNSPDDADVALTSGISRPLLVKSLAEWRDKAILSRGAGELKSIQWITPSGPVTLERGTEPQWKSPEKPEAEADWENLDSIARSFSHLKALSLSEPVSWENAGLEKPEAQVNLYFSGSQKPLQLKLGRLKGADTFYAALSGDPNWENQIFTVTQDVAEKIKFHPEKIWKSSEPNSGPR